MAGRQLLTFPVTEASHTLEAYRARDGYQLADVVPTFGSINMIGGECDR